MERKRCGWVNDKNPLYVKYHDEEWGIPLAEDRELFEALMLECFQTGLSFECVLNKREGINRAFDRFDPNIIAAYGKEKTDELMQNKDIIRNRRKIEAAVINARVFLSIKNEYGSFWRYIISFTGGNMIYEEYTQKTSSPLSDAISKDLKKRGMKFTGSTVIYSYLQAIGIINGHSRDCFCYKG